jgi:hypothetical protein
VAMISFLTRRYRVSAALGTNLDEGVIQWHQADIVSKVGVVESIALLIDSTAERVTRLIYDQHVAVPVTSPNIGTRVKRVFVDFFYLLLLVYSCDALLCL